jgi:hypothetical protein
MRESFHIPETISESKRSQSLDISCRQPLRQLLHPKERKQKKEEKNHKYRPAPSAEDPDAVVGYR